MVKNLPAMQEIQHVWSLGQEDPLEEEITTHSSMLAWRILWTGAWRATVHEVTKSQTLLSHWANWGRENMVPWWKWWSADVRVWMMLTPGLHALLLVQWGAGAKLAKSDLCHPFWVPWPQADWRGQLTYSQPERDLCQSLETKFSVCAQSDFPENCQVWAP